MRTYAMALSLLFIPTLALATSPCMDDVLDGQVLPLNGATDVPLNARVFYFPQGSAGTPVLKDDTGAAVSTTSSTITIQAGSVTVLTPSQPLTANKSYTVSVTSGTLSTFTTGTTTATQAPAVPHVTGEDPITGSYAGGPPWGDNLFAINRVTIDGTAPMVLVDVDNKTTFAPASLSGSAAHLTDSKTIEFDRDGICTVKVESDSAQVRLGALDVAGNFSGWSDPQTVNIPSNGCGCSASNTPRAPWIAILAVLALLRLRRGQDRAG